MGLGRDSRYGSIYVSVPSAAPRLDCRRRGRPTHSIADVTTALLKMMGKLEQARPQYKEALRAKRKTLGDRHPSPLTSISNMGTLLHNMGKLEEARPLLEEDLQASKETLGDRHPDMLISIGYLVVLLRATGDLAEAEAVSPGHIFGESGLFLLRK